MASIRLNNISKNFGTVKAVSNVSLDMPDGEFVALLGPSGCGKTTTLRMISGLEMPDTGRIFIGDRDVTTLPPRDRDIAMVFQDYALYPHMSIHDNIGYPLKVRGIDGGEVTQRVSEVAHSLQIGQLLKRRPGQLSGGQQQRTALARAVVHRAQVYLFDEPLSNLDAKLRLEARAFLKHLQREVGVTGVYVTHDQSEAMALADRIVIMQAGEIMQAGTPLEIYRKPANTFVASFIGSPPMNLLPCAIDYGARTITVADRFHLSGDTFRLPANNARAVTFGIRPEYLHIETQPVPNSIQSTFYVLQTLGSEALVIVRVGEHLVTVRMFGDEIPDLPRDLWLVPEPERVYFYGEDGNLLP
jgi:ABC-type sugar transport system ATPase subunit